MNEPREDIFIAVDGTRRCAWCGSDDLYQDYHDREWGRPQRDDQKLFEKLCLEGFQAGLSWLTILRKRPAFRDAFDGFEIERVASFGPRDVTRLMDNPQIVRNRMKIEAAISNARVVGEIIEEFGSLATFLWQYEPDVDERPGLIFRKTIPKLIPSAERMARDLKKRGFRFIGPVMAYAFMQSVGMVNDHVESCDFRDEIQKAREDFERP